MKTDVIYIDNQGNGFDNVIKDFHKFATYMELDSKESLHLQLCAEEMLSMVRSSAGDMKGAVWIAPVYQDCYGPGKALSADFCFLFPQK